MILFLGDSIEEFFICTVLYGTRFPYRFYLQFIVSSLPNRYKNQYYESKLLAKSLHWEIDKKIFIHIISKHKCSIKILNYKYNYLIYNYI